MDWLIAWSRRHPCAFQISKISVIVVLIVLRRPSAVLRPEFWAEDGLVWWGDAHAYGRESLLFTDAGYLQTVSRLTAIASQPVGLAMAPLLFALVALTCQAAPAIFLLSKRMDEVCPPLAARLVLTVLYIIVPNSAEENVNLTNAQWHLAILMLLLLMSRPYKSRSGRLLDALAIGLAGLSGPFCIMAVPAPALIVALEKFKFSALRAIALLSASVIQVSLIVSAPLARTPEALGASVLSAVKIVSTQIIAAPLLGDIWVDALARSSGWSDGEIPIVLLMTATALSVFRLRRKALWPLILPFSMFSAAVVGAALAQPQVSGSAPQWPLMERIGTGQRYFLLPMLAWLSVVLASTCDKSRLVASFGRVMLLLALIAGVRSFRYRPWPDIGFYAAAETYSRATVGQQISIPVQPVGMRPLVVTKISR